jgi:hypothetical protein
MVILILDHHSQNHTLAILVPAGAGSFSEDFVVYSSASRIGSDILHPVNDRPGRFPFSLSPLSFRTAGPRDLLISPESPATSPSHLRHQTPFHSTPHSHSGTSRVLPPPTRNCLHHNLHLRLPRLFAKTCLVSRLRFDLDTSLRHSTRSCITTYLLLLLLQPCQPRTTLPLTLWTRIAMA